MTEQSRTNLRVLSQCVIVYALVVLGMGYASTLDAMPVGPNEAVSQDGINATLFERAAAMSERLDKIETLLQYAMVGLVGNLVAQLMQIAGKRR